ncbi:MAG TPA: hydroxymethylbilane synthase, partial [Candidatus Methylacidiphilales bacterium]
GGLDTLPKGGAVATGSPRRTALLLHLRPDLRVLPLRGNVDTRLRKLRETAEWSGIVLAAAGLDRLRPAMEGLHAVPLPPDLFLPAPGQGALAFQVRAGDEDAFVVAAALDHAPTRAAVTAERAFLQALGGGCRAPVGAYARTEAGRFRLDGIVWKEPGHPARSGFSEGERDDEIAAAGLGRSLAADLLGGIE